MIMFFLGLTLFLAAFCDAQYQRLEKDQDVEHWRKENWVKLNRVEPEKELELTFAIKQQNADKLERLLLQVSDPDSASYGKYLTVQEITEIISPSKKSLSIVNGWLRKSGVKKCQTTINKDFLVCTMSCKTAENLLLGSVFYYFKHAKYSKLVIRSVSTYYVPSYVTEHLDFVGGLHRFPAVNWGKTGDIDDNRSRKPFIEEIKARLNAGVHVGVYPKVLRQRYNITAQDVGSHPNNSQVVAQFLEQYFSQNDLAEFFKLFVGSEFTHLTSIAKIIGPNSGRSGIEASLDTQYIMGLGANITTWFWSTGGRHANQEPFLEWMMNIGNTTQVPWVHSVSYGDVESSLSAAYMERINTEFMKAGLRGITILFASGDDGAACKENKFSPNFPCSSPYVTSVGGTAFNNPFTVSGEYAYEISGGGFSNVFKMPAYQEEQVSVFLKSGKVPPTKYFNPEGRGYPDIAAICNHFWIVNNRIPVPGVMGTSASTPTVAGIISLVNDARLHAGKPTLGFINPFLYKHPEALYDVTSGCNEGCLAHDKGFCAVPKWDPVTGNGSPNFPSMRRSCHGNCDEAMRCKILVIFTGLR